MPTQHLNRIVAICANARKNALLTWITNNLDASGGADWLSNGLSATGNAPATYWWFNAALTNAQAVLALNRWYAIASMTPPAWGSMTRNQIRIRIASDRSDLIAGSQIGMWLADNDSVWDDPATLLANRGLQVVSS
jgi:hypothetical protein